MIKVSCRSACFPTLLFGDFNCSSTSDDNVDLLDTSDSCNKADESLPFAVVGIKAVGRDDFSHELGVCIIVTG